MEAASGGKGGGLASYRRSRFLMRRLSAAKENPQTFTPKFERCKSEHTAVYPKV